MANYISEKNTKKKGIFSTKTLTLWREKGEKFL